MSAPCGKGNKKFSVWGIGWSWTGYWLAELETKVYKKVCYQGEGPHFSLLKAPTTFHIQDTINY